MRAAGLLLGLLLLTACSDEKSSTRKGTDDAPDTVVTAQDVKRVRVRGNGGKQTVQRSINPRGRVTTSTAEGDMLTTVGAEHGNAGTNDKAVIRGRVVSKHTGGPISSARVTIFDFKDEASQFLVPVLKTGAFSKEVKPGRTYFIRADAEGYGPMLSDVILATTRSAEEKVITLDRGRDVAGRVVDAADTPVPDATVVARLNFNDVAIELPPYDPNAQGNERTIFSVVTSDAQGQFELAPLPENMPVDVVAEKFGYAYPGVYRLTKGDGSTSGVKLQLPLSGPVSGVVVDEDGKPVADTTVTLRNRGTLHAWVNQAETTASGTFQVKCAPYETTSSILVDEPGYETYFKDVVLSDQPLSVTLVREKMTTLTVRCFDAQTMEPVTSVTVTAMQHASTHRNIVVKQAEPGVFRMQMRKGLASWVFGVAEGYMRGFAEITLTDADEQNLEMLMQRSSTLRGRVVDGVSSKPLEGATFTADRRTVPDVKSDAKGRFEFTANAVSGSYAAVTPDGRTKEFKPRQAAGGVVDVGDVVIQGNVTLTVKVVKWGGISAVRGAKVDVHPTGASAVSGITDYDGQIVTEVPGDKQLTIMLPEYVITKSALPSGSNGQWQVTVPVGEGRLTGRLLMNGEPISGKIYGKHRQVAMLATNNNRAGSDGRFDLKNLAPGPWEITAFTMGQHPAYASVNIDIPAGDKPVERDIELGGSGRKISGRVVTEAGDPAPGASARLKTPRSTRNMTTNAYGKFEVAVDIPGECEFTASHDDFGRSDIVKVNVPDSNEPVPPVELVLKGGDASVECTIVSILDGLRIGAGAYFWLEKDGVSYASANQEQGRVGGAVIKGLPPGPYRMISTAAGFSRAERDINLQPGQKLEVTEVLSPAASVSITVVDAQGQILKGATVTVTPLDADSLQQVQTLNTDNRGIARFRSLLYGNYRADVTANDAAASMTFSTSNERQMDLQMVFEPGQGSR